MNLSLVDGSKLAKDPRKLPYLYPKMPVIRYKDLSEDYHRQKTIQAVETVAGMMNMVLLPSSCVHHSRRRPERRTMIYGRTYYLADKDDLTPVEWEKYKILCERN